MKQPGNVTLQNAPNTTEVFFDHATKEKIHKHLSDINDIITEEDIKNIKTDMTVMPFVISMPE